MQKSHSSLLLVILVLMFSVTLHAQDKITAKTDSIRTAPVEVTIVNDKNQPRKGEQVLFTAQKSKKVFTAYSNAMGKAAIALPAGDDYAVTVKALTDTSKYGVLKVPPLAPGQFFKDAITVDIAYEPAKEFTLNDVKYDVGKATLKPESSKQLQDLLDYLQWKTDIKIEVAGYTDNVGNDNDNLKLSQQRAETVKTWLVKKGIIADRVIAKGYGSSQPVADNTTEAGRQQNRRTEVHIL